MKLPAAHLYSLALFFVRFQSERKKYENKKSSNFFAV